MMNKNLVNNLVEKFAELSHIKVNHHNLFTEKGRYFDNHFDNLDQFFDRLYDTGNFVNFLFAHNSLASNKFIQLLKTLTYPIIAFKKNEETLVPLLIYKHKGKLQCIQFEDDIYFDKNYRTEEALAKDLMKVLDVSWKYNFRFDSKMSDTGRNISKDIFFVTGFPVKPLLSSEENDAHHEGKYGQPEEDHDQHQHVHPLVRLWRLMNIERREISYIYFFAVLVGIVNLALPLGIQSIITLISGGMVMQSIVVLALVIIFATGFSGYIQIQQIQFVELLQQRVFAKAAYEFSFRIPKIKMERITREYGPELVNRFFDVLNIQKSLPKFLIDLTAATLQIFFGLLLLSFYHSMFVFFGILLITVIILIIYFSGPKGLESSITESKYKYKVAYWLEELARNLTTFKLAGYTNLTIEKTDIYLSNYLIYRQKHFKILRGQYIAIVVFKTFITAGLLIMGGLLVMENQINLGQFIAAELIIVLVIAAVEKLIGSLDVIYDLLTALDKVGHVTDLPLESTIGIKLDDIPKNDQFTIEIKNMSYTYPGGKYPVLKDIGFKVSAGQKICISGPNDSGKTTLIKILTGLLHEYEGGFTFNDIPLKDINIYSYRDTIGENISHDEIFEGTIEENITVGKSGISLESLMWAIHQVGLDDFVKHSPEGLRTLLTGGAANVASNIRQKIILARSIAEMPRLLVMDDEFFSEPNEKVHLINLLFNQSNEWALVMVTNDPTLLAKADLVIHLDNGEIKHHGRFEDLVQYADFSSLVSYQVP